MSYNFIFHPITNQRYAIQSKEGRQILHSYLQIGGKVTLKKFLDKNKNPLLTYDYIIPLDNLTDNQYDSFVEAHQQVEELSKMRDDELKFIRGEKEKGKFIKSIDKLILPLKMLYYPMITFYFYENYLFIRPAFSRIEDAFQCKKKNKLALTIAQLFEQFRDFD